MCTVSFIPAKDRVFITSNRDEKLVRSKAIPPQQYNAGNVRLVLPKDSEAGGTWIVLRENGDAAVLLNGGLQKHLPLAPYKRSRGLILLDIIKETEHVNHFMQMNLEKIEPFTLVILEKNKLYECRWNGTHKTSKELSNTVPQIWSSVTLFDEVAIRKRESWFTEWLRANPDPVSEDIIQFHLSGGEGDDQNDFRMNRNNHVLTVSVTNIEIKKDTAKMKYFDLIDNRVYEYPMNFLPAYAK